MSVMLPADTVSNIVQHLLCSQYICIMYGYLGLGNRVEILHLSLYLFGRCTLIHKQNIWDTKRQKRRIDALFRFVLK